MNLIKLSVRRPVLVAMFMSALVGLGIFCYLQLPMELFPDVEFPVVTVVTRYEGAGPEEIEQLITKELEEEISTVEGIKHLNSISQQGLSLVMAEFYLETVEKVFQTYDLPLGKLQYRGRTVNPAAIRRTALMTVEGERDDICAVGQTVAAQDLCSSIRPYMKTHHIQTGVGHYGVFSGRRWNQQIYPRVRDMIHASVR